MSTASNASNDPSGAPAEARTHTAGAYDVRTVIAGLIGLYGIVLTIMGLVANDDAAKAKTGNWNADLWSGIVMIVIASQLAAQPLRNEIVWVARQDIARGGLRNQAIGVLTPIPAVRAARRRSRHHRRRGNCFASLFATQRLALKPEVFPDN